MLLTRAVLPNLVWRAGRVASTIRKVALASLLGMLKADLFDPATLRALWAQWNPPCKTALSDDDGLSRYIACLFFQRVFHALQPLQCIDGEQVRDLYPELVKRLDDSEDRVRLAVLATLRAFFRAVPPAESRGAPVEYTTDCLLVHADDTDPRIQAAAEAALRVCATVDPEYVAKHAARARTRHRSPELCDRLLRLCRKRQAQAAASGAAATGTSEDA